MKLTDKEVSDLIKASDLNGKDNFFIFSSMPDKRDIEDHAASFYGRSLVLSARKTFFNNGEKVIYADIKAAADDDFGEFLVRENIEEILLPFYECADVHEYGFRASYALLAEVRAATEKRFHLTGYSLNAPEDEDVFSLFGTKSCIFAGIKKESVYKGIKTESPRSRFYYTAAECEKSPLKKTAVMFSTRSLTEEFSLFLYKRRTPFALIHGGMEEAKQREELNSFISGERNVLLTTKFIIPSYSLIKADALIYCGLPYSASHLNRCGSLSKQNTVKCVFCEEDISLTQNLIRSFAEELGMDDPKYIEKRNKMFFDFLNILEY